jgi:DNA polymerase-1
MRVLERRPVQGKPPELKLVATEPDAAETQPEYAPIKVVLANTSLKIEAVLKLLATDQRVGFDTEAAGPLLRGRDFINVSYAAPLGVSLSFEGGKNYYIPVRHVGNNASLSDLDRVGRALEAACKQRRVWAHNAKFDHQIAAKLGWKLEGLLDSMIAAWLITGKNRGIGLKELAETLLDRKCPPYDPSIGHKPGDAVKIYAGHDSRNTLDLGLYYEPRIADRGLTDWLVEECTFTHTLADMKVQGMRINYGMLRTLGVAATEEQNRILAEWDTLAPDVKISSAKQLQNFFIEGIWVPKGRTKGGAFSTSGTVMKYNVKNAKGDGKRLAQLRLDYQEVAKIVSTYSDELVEEARQWADGRLHPDLFHFGTVTGRLSSANPNIQNQPARGQYAKLVREAFIPDEGCVFTSADYSQVELRYFAEYCGGTLLEAFLNGGDLHQRTADAMGITRDKGKTVNFGFLLYGGAPEKLAKDVLGCSESEAEDKIKALHAEYPEVEKWRQKIIQQADDSSPTIPHVYTKAGRIRYIPELNPEYMRAKMPEAYAKAAKKYYDRCKIYGRKPKPNGEVYSVRSSGERLVVNYLIQGGARDLLVLGMNYFRHHRKPDWQIVTTVHDEVMIQHHPIDTDLAQDALKEALESAGPALGLKVPILAQPKTGWTWAEVK